MQKMVFTKIGFSVAPKKGLPPYLVAVLADHGRPDEGQGFSAQDAGGGPIASRSFLHGCHFPHQPTQGWNKIKH